MASSFLEIVELENGDIVLKRVDDDSEPLVSIRFSEESKSFIDEARVDVAKIMIQAGVQAVARFSAAETNESQPRGDENGKGRVVH